MHVSRIHQWLLLLVGMLGVATLGWLCLTMPIANGLARLSYDLPFAIRSNLSTSELCLVRIDEKSSRVLQQPMGSPWDRRLYARLVRTLKEAGARAVLLDFSFVQPAPDPAVDVDFAAAMRESGNVFIGTDFEPVAGQGAVGRKINLPDPVLRKAAAGWGLLIFDPVDDDYGVRRISSGTALVPTVTWRLARHLGAALPEEPEPGPPFRWFNYYGPPGMFRSVSLSQALQPFEIPPDFFRDRIVVVGGKLASGNLGDRRDEFRTPYTRWGESFAAGVEIHATALLNLLRGDWLIRMNPRMEWWLIPLLGAGIFALLFVVCSFGAWRALGCAALLVLAIAAAACWGAWQHRVWFAWMIPVAVQTPAALFLTVGAHYALETRRRAAIRRAFSLYLSPHMADEIANSRFDLKPGGELVEVTMMFTDLQGFTPLAEKLHDPQELSEILTAYFNNTTKHILENRGTILKYVGDAVHAVWGAPLPDDDHAGHGVLAAWAMHQFGKLDVHGHQLVTRIGINTGTVLAGNLGSDFRFDYSLIGDAVNLASRLEGLNKNLGTRVLLTQSTWERVSDRFAARKIGRFRVKGREEDVTVYELLGPKVSPIVESAMDAFAEGLEAFTVADFAKARAAFENACKLRGGGDGPSEFYLVEIAHHEAAGIPEGWDGIIELSGK